MKLFALSQRKGFTYPSLDYRCTYIKHSIKNSMSIIKRMSSVRREDTWNSGVCTFNRIFWDYSCVEICKEKQIIRVRFHMNT